MLALYLLTLALSAGITGLYGHQLLATQGFVPVFRAGLFLALGVSFSYITIQLVYMLLVRLYKPTRAQSFLVLESVSHLAALVLLPFALRVSVAWPHPALVRFEPLIYLAAFGGLHLFFKLMSFFAAVRGDTAPRLPALGWGVGALICGGVAAGGLFQWVDTVESTRPVVSGNDGYLAADGQYAKAQLVGEGAVLERELVSVPGQGASFYLARDPEAPADAPRDIHVTLIIGGGDRVTITKELRLSPDGWTALRLSPEEIPQAARSCRIVWNSGEAPPWERFSGLLPVVTSERRLLLAGPIPVELRTESSGPNVAVLVLDGLGPGRGLPYGDPSRSVQTLTRLAAVSVSFSNAYASAPEPDASVLSLMTGQSPLHHGNIGRRRAPLPDDTKTLAERFREKGYLTAAFTEAERPLVDTSDPESGLGRGFDLFALSDGAAAGLRGDVLQVESPAAADGAAPSVSTARRALSWLEANQGAKFMLFLRLKPLATGGDVTATAIANWDRSLAQLIQYFREDHNTCVVLTAPCGRAALTDTTGGAPALTEAALQVPLVFFVPGVRPGEREDILSLEDAGFALLRAAGGDKDFLNAPEAPKAGSPKPEPPAPIATEAISVSGDPIALSIRSDKWRLTWQTGVSYLAPDTPADPGSVSLYDVSRLRRGTPPSNVASRNPDTTARLREHLQVYLQTHLGR